MDGPVPGGWSAAEQDEIWARWRCREALRTIARHFGRDMAYVRRFLARTGGRRLPPRWSRTSRGARECPAERRTAALLG